MPLRSGNAYIALPPLPPLVSTVTTTFQSPGRDVTSTTMTSRSIASTIPIVSSPNYVVENLFPMNDSMANDPLLTQTGLFSPVLSLSNSFYYSMPQSTQSFDPFVQHASQPSLAPGQPWQSLPTTMATQTTVANQHVAGIGIKEATPMMLPPLADIGTLSLGQPRLYDALRRKPGMEKFDGNGPIPAEMWIGVFEQLTEGLSDRERVNLLVSYLEKDAFRWYALIETSTTGLKSENFSTTSSSTRPCSPLSRQRIEPFPRKNQFKRTSTTRLDCSRSLEFLSNRSSIS